MTPRRPARAPARAPAIRHCPLCGVAMQASKSRADRENFDIFRCLTCHTTIVVAAAEAAPPQAKRAQAK